MINNLLNEIEQAMLPILDNEQLGQLRKVLEYTFRNVSVTEKESVNTESNNQALIDSFVAAKKVEGCSDKSILYYKSTINNALVKIDKEVVHITTDDLRNYLNGYQAASGAGAAAMAELEQQYREVLDGKPATVNKFAYQLAYNVIPQIDVFTDNGYTKEEMKMFNETRKIMHTDAACSAMCVRVPSLRSHSEAVWIETEKPISPEEAREAMAKAEGITVVDDPSNKKYPMPLFTAGEDDVFVGRIRKDLANENGLTFWLCGDQIKKGAALNAVQIAEYLIKVGDVK